MAVLGLCQRDRKKRFDRIFEHHKYIIIVLPPPRRLIPTHLFVIMFGSEQVLVKILIHFVNRSVKRFRYRSTKVWHEVLR